MIRWVVLLYSVVLNPTRRVTAQDLTTLAVGIGVLSIKTVLSTGNLILDDNSTEADLTARLEAAIAQDWGKAMPVLVRSAADWRALVAVNPFPEPSLRDPAKVAVRVMRHEPDPATLAKISQKTAADDQFAATPRALWLASAHPLGTSPLLRALSSAKVGIGTWRNASALTKIAAALD